MEESKPDFVKFMVKISIKSRKTYAVVTYKFILGQSIVVEGFYN